MEAILTDWYLLGNGEVFALGDVHNSFKFPEGYFIHTSIIEEMKINTKEEAITIRTYSGSFYRMEFKSINGTLVEGTIDAIKSLIEDKKAECNDSIKKIASTLEEHAVKSKENKEIEKAKKEEVLLRDLQPRSLYLEVKNGECSKAYFKRGEINNTDIPALYEISPYLHTGIIQDSVLISDHKYGLVDYRYFPVSNKKLETYHWSDGLDRIVIKNLSSEIITLDDVTVLPMLTSVVVKTKNTKEELLNPDFVNGKSLINPSPETT